MDLLKVRDSIRSSPFKSGTSIKGHADVLLPAVTSVVRGVDSGDSTFLKALKLSAKIRKGLLLPSVTTSLGWKLGKDILGDA